MSKYIDADKLKAEIERRKDIYIGHALCLKETNLIDGFDEALNIIESLQQEPRFPQYDNIVEKIFGAGNLEWWERNEAEMLVALAKEELLKSLQQERLETPSGEEVMTMCNQILIDWVKEGKTPEEREQRERAHIRFFELYDEYMQEQPEVDLEKEWKNLNPTMLTYAAEVFGGKTLLEDISYSYRRELAEYFRDLAKSAKDGK